MSEVNIADIEGVHLQTGKISADERGTFTKFFDRKEYENYGIDLNFNSIAIASNFEAGTLRGLHFQSVPYEEAKMVICLYGRIFDVIVDLRKDSQTLGKWAGIEMSDAEPPATLFLPKGVAHGYQTLTPKCKVFYAMTSEFKVSNAHSLSYADSDLQISWPLPVTCLSTRDSNGLSLDEAVGLSTGRQVS